MPSRRTAALQTIAVLASMGTPLMRAMGVKAPSHRGACPQCVKGRVQESKGGARYCHRCGWFETADVARAQLELEKLFPKEPR